MPFAGSLWHKTPPLAVFLNMESGRKMAVEFTQEVVSDALEDSLSLTGNRREIARHKIDSFPAWKPPAYPYAIKIPRALAIWVP